MEMDGETDRGRSEGRNGASQEAETSESLLRHRELMSRMFQESSARSSKGTAEAWFPDRKSTRLNSSHSGESRMPSSA